jgi:hypothetical protein
MAPHRKPAPIWALNGRITVEKSSTVLRLVFAHKCPEGKGDNCLLTLDSAYVDLAFSPLLALRGSVLRRFAAATT